MSHRTPVLVGVGVATQREEDPARALEPALLMERALRRAGEDSGVPGLLGRADSIRAPRGFWSYPDPCRLIADRLGAGLARTEVAEIGVLQTTLLGRAGRDIAESCADVVLVTGGEARHRALRARIAGIAAPESPQEACEPDTVLRPLAEIVHPLEVRHGLGAPVAQYAVIENALRFAEGRGVEEHRTEVAALQVRMSRVASENPDAWRRKAATLEEIRDAVGGNRMLAFPYTKLHTSQWNVDQAAGLVLCSLETARSAGVPEDRMVFPRAVVDSNHMVPLCERRTLHRSPGFSFAAARALAHAGLEASQVEHLELYSCFPVAVRVQARELCIRGERELTVTGGMTFAGGPLNNFVLQSVAKMADVLRADPGSAGLVTAVSGILTKQGVSLWSTDPGVGFCFADVSEETARAVERVELVPGARGTGCVVGGTVIYESGEPATVVLVCDLADGRRALATSADRAVAELLTREELCGREVQLEGERALLRS